MSLTTLDTVSDTLSELEFDQEDVPLRPGKRVSWHSQVKTLSYYEPKLKDTAAALYEDNRFDWEDRIESEEVEESEAKFCFLNPIEGGQKINPPHKPPKNINLDKRFKSWRHMYFKEIELYEKEDRQVEDETVAEFQEQYADFPHSEEFSFVFKQFRMLREFLSRIRNLKTLQVFRMFISAERFDLAKQIIEYIEKDSLFLDSIDAEDFDEVWSISNELMETIFEEVDLKPDPDTQERWLAYFTFLRDPRSEFNRLKRIWEDTYIHLLSSGIFQALIIESEEILSSLIRWPPVSSVASNPTFQLNPYLRADLFFSKRTSTSCPARCSGHRGRLLLLMITLNNRSMVEKLLKNDVAINSNLCAGNAIKIHWEQEEIDDGPGDALDPLSDKFDVEQYEIRRRQREQQKLEEEDPVAAMQERLNESLPDFDAVSMESDDEDDLIAEDRARYKPSEPDYELVIAYERKTAISTAVDLGDEQMLRLLLEYGANPLQHRDSGVRAIQVEDVIAMTSADNESARGKVAALVIDHAERLLSRESNARSGRGIDIVEASQKVYSMLMSQGASDCGRNTFNLTRYYECLSSYMFRNSPGGRRIIESNARHTARRSVARSGSSVNSHMSRGSVFSSMSKSVTTVAKRGWGRVKSRVFKGGSTIFAGRSTLGRQRGAGTLMRQDSNGRRSAIDNGREYKFFVPSEDFYVRIVMGFDYCFSNKKLAEELPHIHMVDSFLSVLEERRMLLDLHRMKQLVAVLLKAIASQKAGAKEIFERTFFHHTVMACFFGIIPRKQHSAHLQLLTDHINIRRYRDKLKLKDNSCHYKKVGRGLLIDVMVFLGKQEPGNDCAFELLSRMVEGNRIKLTHKEVVKYFVKVSNSGNVAATALITDRYPQHFESEDPV